MIDALTLPAPLPEAGLEIRRAHLADLEALIRLMSDDPISAARGDVSDPADEPLYRAALEAVVADPSNELVVAVDPDGVVVGTLQLTRIPGLARRGSTRLLVEAVRVASDRRSAGIGSALMRWVMEVVAPSTDAQIVQLTSDAKREAAHRFYERLGFDRSHLGFKYLV
ncbi:GNAT family N-acetyltransferase [Microbacterium indicum]|uniref:GNAT family N-acetyltransferase n=1 Tax=Microbacterium indicum TaxID=358100 RepID=UPI0003FFD5B4|nr:GNAT family N-acetyltransferase [Microbacterium indicum]